MADSYVLYTASGSTDTYNITFGYLAPENVEVLLDGVSTPFTFPSLSQIQITSGNPSLGAIVNIKRITPRDAREIVWQNAANLTADDLNTADLQVLYIMQEAFDGGDDTLKIGAEGVFDAESKRIQNIAEPIDDADAVTKGYLGSFPGSNLAEAVAAKDAAEDAQEAAELAETNATAVLSSAMLKSNNLNDVVDKPDARTNLNVYSKGEVYSKSEVYTKSEVDLKRIVGEVVTVLALTAPAGTLELDGAMLPRASFVDLYAHLTTAGLIVSEGGKDVWEFGDGDGSTTFSLGNFSTLFPRYWDSGSGRSLGSFEDDALKSHNHSLNVYNSSGGEAKAGSGVSGYEGLASTGYFGDTETRPKNIALLACIIY